MMYCLVYSYCISFVAAERLHTRAEKPWQSKNITNSGELTKMTKIPLMMLEMFWISLIFISKVWGISRLCANICCWFSCVVEQFQSLVLILNEIKPEYIVNISVFIENFSMNQTNRKWNVYIFLNYEKNEPLCWHEGCGNQENSVTYDASFFTWRIIRRTNMNCFITTEKFFWVGLVTTKALLFVEKTCCIAGISLNVNKLIPIKVFWRLYDLL